MVSKSEIVAALAFLSVVATGRNASAQFFMDLPTYGSGLDCTPPAALKGIPLVPVAVAVASTVGLLSFDAVALARGQRLPLAYGVAEIAVGAVALAVGGTSAAVVMTKGRSWVGDAKLYDAYLGLAAPASVLGAVAIGHGIWTVVDGNREDGGPEVEVSFAVAPAPGASVRVTF